MLFSACKKGQGTTVCWPYRKNGLFFITMYVYFYHLLLTVKSFNFMGTKFRRLMTMDMFIETWICGFQIVGNITKLKWINTLVGSWIHGLPYPRKSQIKCPRNEIDFTVFAWNKGIRNEIKIKNTKSIKKLLWIIISH